MTILTALVLIIGVGALMNRGEDGGSIFGGSGTYRAQPDVFTLRAGRVQSLDVLLNDYNADRVNADELAIVKAPNCGSALVVAGTIQYSESHSCEGRVEMAYCVPFEDVCELTVVTLNVLKVENIPALVSSNGKGEPAIMTDVAQGNAPTGFANETFAMAAPVRLEVPNTSEVKTPTEAVAEIRNRTVDVAVAVSVEPMGNAETSVSVDNSTARVGRVAGGDVALQAPTVEGEDSNITIASSGSRPNVSAPRASAPQGFGTAEPGTQFAAPSSPLVPTAPVSPSSPRNNSAEPARTQTATNTQPTRPQAPVQTTVAPQVETAPVIASVTPAPNVGGTADASDVVATADIGAPSQLAGPTAQDTPDDSGVLASLARSNSFLGVTVSAAKGLLSPDDGDRSVRADTTIAARPTNFEVASGISNDSAPIIESARNIPLPQIELPVTPDAPAPARIVASLDTSGDSEVLFRRISRPAATPAIAVETPAETTIKPQAEQTEVAALTFVEPATRPTTPEATTACGVDMSLQVRTGAELVATVVSPCRPGQRFEVDHAGLVFTAETDLDGVANFIVPAMTSSAEVKVQFPDGASQSETTQVPNMDRVTRVAVMWSSDIDFDLHAREFGAQTGTAGHVWAQHAGDYGSACRAGGGYLMQLGPQSGAGNKAEVYTIIQSSRTQSGLIDLSLELAGFGQQCDEKPVIRTLRSEDAAVDRDRDIQLDVGNCAAGQQVVVRNAIQDIRIAGR